MGDRKLPYVIVFLLAAVVALVPPAIWPDVVFPFEDNWNNWYWKGQPYPRPHYTLQNPPALFRGELAIFKALVLPPAYARRIFRGVPTDYGVLWVKPYIETAGVPPLASSAQHVAWALPLWFVVFAAAYEAWRRVKRRAV
ncbi:MAG TPA: hypothetical protein VLV78_11670 [Thermoanaerobaculia bacterium]|nr:hypothetical protein [Thermoanaerobaculia bacterium]